MSAPRLLCCLAALLLDPGRGGGGLLGRWARSLLGSRHRLGRSGTLITLVVGQPMGGGLKLALCGRLEHGCRRGRAALRRGLCRGPWLWWRRCLLG